MFVVPVRFRPECNGPSGVVATAPIKKDLPAWGAGGNDNILKLDDVKRLTSIEFEALMLMGWVRLSYSRAWVVAGDFRHLRFSDHKTPANLRCEFDILVADKYISRNEELVAPAEFDADRDWKNRMVKSQGWKRKNNQRAANPDLKTYLAYIERTG